MTAKKSKGGFQEELLRKMSMRALRREERWLCEQLDQLEENYVLVMDAIQSKCRHRKVQLSDNLQYKEPLEQATRWGICKSCSKYLGTVQPDGTFLTEGDMV